MSRREGRHTGLSNDNSFRLGSGTEERAQHCCSRYSIPDGGFKEDPDGLKNRQGLGFLLAAQVQAVGYFDVTRIARLTQISQQSAALANQLEQTAAARFIVFVRAQVLGQLGDAVGQNGDLNFGRTGVGIMTMKILDRLGLDFLSEWHDVCFLSLELQVSMSAASLMKTAYRGAGPVTGEDYTRKRLVGN
jgi:hypothetical protein